MSGLSKLADLSGTDERPKVDRDAVERAAGLPSREPAAKPMAGGRGRKRTAQVQICIRGPEDVIDKFDGFCGDSSYADGLRALMEKAGV